MYIITVLISNRYNKLKFEIFMHFNSFKMKKYWCNRFFKIHYILLSYFVIYVCIIKLLLMYYIIQGCFQVYYSLKHLPYRNCHNIQVYILVLLEVVGYEYN